MVVLAPLLLLPCMFVTAFDDADRIMVVEFVGCVVTPSTGATNVVADAEC